MKSPIGLLLVLAVFVAPAWSQSRKPKRARAPQFEAGALSGVFFEDPVAKLQGELPKAPGMAVPVAQPAASDQVTNASPSNAGQDAQGWKSLITPAAVEDLVKGAKLRLDRIVTTPAAFNSGGFVTARTEFSMLAVLFAVIEDYPGDQVRWKESAAVARELMARVAANTKVGSFQTYNEAKSRLLDLGDLLNGSQLPGEAKTELDWSALIDRVPLMKLLEWSQSEVNQISASESSFQSRQDELRMYASLISVLGKVSLAEDMPDSTDDDYAGFVDEMVKQARQIGLAVETGNADNARLAAGRLGQCCQDCHENFR